MRRSFDDAVARTYTRAKASAIGTKLAGYRANQLAGVPSGVSSFGCGNPLGYIDVRAGDTVLDLGSGAGLDLILAGQTVGPAGTVIGVDMTDAMIERARANVARAGLTNVEIRRGKIEALPVADGSVDWVISNCVISLSADKPQVFREIARVLRPGGRMLISDMVVDARLEWVLRRLAPITPALSMARTEPSYLDGMRRAGLVDVDVIDRKVYEAAELFGLFAGAVAQATSLRARVGRAPAKLIARAAAGHIWSSKFQARRPH